MQCASVRKRGSRDQCPALAISNSDFCGRHARMKNPVRWVDSIPKDSVPKLQALVRGWLTRVRIKLAGPGVLRRKDCVNDEEMVTFEDKTRVHPHDYFGWEENGKVWWMSIPSMGQLVRDQLHPVNPYTKVPLSMDVRRRFRKLRCYCARYKIPTTHTPAQDVPAKIQQYNTAVCQALEENGYEGIHPEEWSAMERLDLYTYVETLTRMLAGWALEKPERPWRVGLSALARRICRDSQVHIQRVRYYAACLSATCLIQDRQLPDVLFMIVSARYRALRT